MKKLVYLHELDSVRTSNAGISRGLECLFEEVVKNGNYVAVSMNQLADSKIFFSAIQDKENYNHILRLFEKGVIRISRYMTSEGEIRTPSQYMLQSLNKNISSVEKQNDIEAREDSFITSALPIKHNDKEMLKIMRDAIMFSDPDSIRAKCKDISFGTTIEKKNEIVEYLCTYVSFILSISKMQLAGNPPKKEKAFDYGKFMVELKNFDVSKWFSGEEELCRIYTNVLTKTDLENKKTILELAGAYAAKKHINNRSNWHNYFSLDDENDNAIKHFGTVLQEDELLFAEMLVDLCYNYTVEESITNISLHYRSFEDKESLHADIKERILQYWGEIKSGIYTPRTEEITEYIPYPRDAKHAGWDTSSRVILEEASAGNAEVYEDHYQKEKKVWTRKLRWTIIKNLAIAILYIVIFCVSDVVTGYIQDFISVLLSKQIANNPLFDIVLNIGVFVFLFSIVNSRLAQWINLPDILESVRAIKLSIKDSVVVRRIKERAYRRKI
ncbi:MAG: hypothetical protein IJZ53_13895 [Tyzzerella sp.]|nr:hypothetical protein [Tyzzerella sp.]